MKNYFTLLLLLFSIHQYGQQTVIDSLNIVVESSDNKEDIVVAYNRLGELHWNVDPNVAVSYAEKGLELARKINFKAGIANTLNTLGILMAVTSEYRKAILYLEESIKIHQELGNSKSAAGVLGNIGGIYLKLADYDKALDCHLLSIKAFEEINDSAGIAIESNSVGAVYTSIKSYENAIEFYNKGLIIEKALNNKINQSICLNNLGSTYFKVGENKLAIQHLQDAVNISTSINDKRGVANALNSLGEVNLHLNKLNEGEENLQRARAIFIEIQDRFSEANSMQFMAAVFVKRNEFKESIVQFQTALKIAKEIKAKDLIMSLYKDLSDAYFKNKEYKNAYLYHTKMSLLSDSIFNETKSLVMANMQAKYESDKKEQEIILLNEKTKLQEEQTKVKDLQLKAKNKWIYSLLGGGVFVLLIVILFILRQRAVVAKKQAEFMRKQAELKQQALRAQMNPHFLFNSLNSIQRMYVEGKTDLASDYLSDFSSLLRKILNNTSEEFISVREDVDMLILYLELEKVRTDNLINYQIILDEKINTTIKKIPPLIIQPFVENAIWHGILPTKRAGQITITISYENEHQLNCSIEDNGVGYFTSRQNKKTTHQSKGMKITEQRLGIKNAVKIEELEEGGTLINLKIPTK